ncbi:hypothetical protein VNO80_00620 [Phaseolus coccineus]|uniref:Uncharacterized protein n=1 Tax=Phaseolus coccineus TaxID=3886 RepID=A0AAN9P494_PHACN
MKTRGKEEEEEASKRNQTMIMMMREEDQEEEEKAMAIWDCGSPLYDSHELVSLDHIIDRHLMAFPSSIGSSKHIITRFTRHSHHHHDMVPHKHGSPEKSKGSFMVTSMSKISVKMVRKNSAEIKGNKMRRGFAGFVVGLLFSWKK